MRQQVQKLRDCYDLVRLFRHLHLAKLQPLAGGEGRNHVDRSLAAPFVTGPAHRLAIDGDHSSRHSAHRGYPGDEAALELLGVETARISPR
jgi:hypothetical protein